jgi:hypothetical protein
MNSQKHFEQQQLDRGEVDIAKKRAHDRFNQQNNLIVRDYLLPEIRALEDRNDVKSIKQAMQLG